MIKKVKDLRTMVLNTLLDEYDPDLIKNEPWYAILPFEVSKMIIELASKEAEYLPPLLFKSSRKELFVYGALRTVELYQSLEGIDAKFLKWYYGITTRNAIPRNVAILADKLNRPLVAVRGAALSIYQEVLDDVGPAEIRKVEETVRQLYYTPLRLEFTSVAHNISRGCGLTPSWTTRWGVLAKEYSTLGAGVVLGFVKDLVLFCRNEVSQFGG